MNTYVNAHILNALYFTNTMSLNILIVDSKILLVFLPQIDNFKQ
jgi:hypothetical protein